MVTAVDSCDGSFNDSVRNFLDRAREDLLFEIWTTAARFRSQRAVMYGNYEAEDIHIYVAAHCCDASTVLLPAPVGVSRVGEVQLLHRWPGCDIFDAPVVGRVFLAHKDGCSKLSPSVLLALH